MTKQFKIDTTKLVKDWKEMIEIIYGSHFKEYMKIPVNERSCAMRRFIELYDYIQEGLKTDISSICNNKFIFDSFFDSLNKKIEELEQWYILIEG